ncbi:hypothetical protein AB0K15_41775 [Amycolatopsis sp. NPDC049253]|uniref:hypothetical protein n=1 Tax=Amycolatopsis sp. NPDC049253 TaxID=3155274 RepID=UPI003443D7A1
MTGATGTIGSAIVAELRSRSETVIAHGRRIRTSPATGPCTGSAAISLPPRGRTSSATIRAESGGEVVC